MSRSRVQCSSGLERKLLAYAAAAGAMTFVPSLHAQVIYTKTNIVLQDGSAFIDLNHDGIADFTLVNSEFASYYFHGGFLNVIGDGQESPYVLAQAAHGFAALAVPHGVPIGSDSPAGFRSDAGPISMAHGFYSYNGKGLGGRFANAGERYLGLKFTLSGQVHYGWARLDVFASFRGVTATLSGYAYESTPNKSIPAGYRGFVDDGSLASLSLGAAGRK